MTVQYISLARAKEAMQTSYNGNDDTALTDCLLAACDFSDRYTNHQSGGFAIQTYDELYHGTGDQILFLRQYPVQSISKIATTSQPSMYVRNNDSDIGVRATVQVNATMSGTQYTSTGITLTRVKNATTTTNTLTWASYPTITTLVAAINALGNNWEAGVMGGLGGWSTTDIRGTQGAFGCRIVNAYLWVHWMDLPDYRMNEITGEVFCASGFHRGEFAWRVIYSAGWGTIVNGGYPNGSITGLPYDLQQAIAELAAATYYAKNINANTQSESLGGALTYSQVAEKSFNGLSLLSKKTFQAYKRRSVPHFSTY